jgi:hypothetical protein
MSCWHCTHPHAYWITWAWFLSWVALVICLGEFRALAVLWVLMAAVVLYANFGRRVWAVIR